MLLRRNNPVNIIIITTDILLLSMLVIEINGNHIDRYIDLYLTAIVYLFHTFTCFKQRGTYAARPYRENGLGECAGPY